MKQQAKRVQYTIRGVPAEVDRALRQIALRRDQSLNRVIVDELSSATVGSRKIADFSDVIHTSGSEHIALPFLER